MKNLMLFIVLLILCTSNAFAQSTITIKGKVQFSDRENFEIKIIEQDGPEKKEVTKTILTPNKTYSIKMTVNKPGVYTLNCGNWQSVQFWAENENLEIDFRGADTAKMPIKNPPYVKIKGGKNNDLMNLYNYDAYRAYQNMIAISQATYFSPMADSVRDELSSKLYTMNNNDRTVRTGFLIENNMDCNSVMAILPSISDTVLIQKVLAQMEAKNPNYPPLLKYKADRKAKEEQKIRTALGQPAPQFSYPTPDGLESIGPADFIGKFLVVDFWASWCGPCRAEVPNMKAIYADYKDKGVEFLSVSIDSKPQAWHEALQDEQMPWAQVLAPSSGKEITKAYNFSGIPYIILIDQKGRVIAKGLRGEKMRKAIEDAITGKLTAEPKRVVAMGAMSM